MTTALRDLLVVAAVVCCIALLAACGGGGDADDGRQFVGPPDCRNHPEQCS